MAYLDNVTNILQIQPDGLPTVVRLSQNENGRRLYFRLVGNEDPIPGGVTVTISGTKPDGVVYSATGSITNDVVLINEETQMTARAGTWDAKIKITSSGQTIATGRVRFEIDADTVAPGSVPSDSELEGLVAEAQAYAENARSAAYGSPLTASTVAGMTDQTRVYVYTGSEAGYTAGNWYYWNGSAWTDGGTYNSVAVQTDTTLAIPGMAAGAKATGDAIDGLDARLDTAEDDITDLKSDLQDMQDEIDSIDGISDEVKEALLACFERVMWIDDDGHTAYDDLYYSLYGQRPAVEPTYDLSKIDYIIGGGGPSEIYTWSGNTRSLTGYRIFAANDMTNRARMRSFMPAVSGTITAMPGYEIVAYLFDSIQFASSWDYNPKSDTRNKFGNSGGINFNTQYPAWVDSFTIEDNNCKFILLAFRKTNNADWTQTELQNMYGTVYNASLSPSYKLFDIAEYTGGYTYGEGDMVKDVTVVDGGISHKRTYVRKSAVSARATIDYLPITKGIFRSADPSKYQICLYQIDAEGGMIWDVENPHGSGGYAIPAWADEYDLSLNPKQDEVFCVCISFKKLDGTDFTSDELSNMYGTVFTYSEEE